MSAAELQESLSCLVAKPVHLTITDNSHSMISVQGSDRGYRVRLHHMFLGADDTVLKALAAFIASPGQKAPVTLKKFVDNHAAKIKTPASRPRRPAPRPAGGHFNLEEILKYLNREYFQGQINCSISWGRQRKARPRRTIRLGSYSEQTRTIYINPVLDREYVPAYVISGVVYHEMLHNFLGTESRNGRNISHSQEFRRLESRFADHYRMQKWIDKNRERLLGKSLEAPKRRGARR